MFKEMFNALKSKHLLLEMCKEFIKMLEDCQRMFERTLALFHHEEPVRPEVKKEIHDIDVGVNQAERRIRKQLIEHLSMSPGSDVPLSLVLMSTTKDVERVGDFCKNLYEVAEMMREPLESDEFGRQLLDLLHHTRETFPKVILAFKESDQDAGRAVLQDEVRVSDWCDDLIAKFAESDLPTRKAVCYTLLARHLKRIDAHLANVATAVVMPVHKLDFFDEKWTRRPVDDKSVT